MAQQVTLKERGLYSFSSQIGEMPQGALLEASNVIINRDGIIESRRGFSLYGNSFSSSPTRAKQLMLYKGRILRHFSNTIQFDDGNGNFTNLSGSFTEPTAGTRIKSIEGNGNFFFTTSDGIKKISVSKASDLSTTVVTSAGGIKALDGQASLNSDLGFFTQDSSVAYRIVWGITDANKNLVLGSPSERIVIQNPILPLLITSFNSTLAALDTAAAGSATDLLSDTNYSSSLSVLPTDTAQQLKIDLLALGPKLDDDMIVNEKDLPVSISVTNNLATLTFASDVSPYLAGGDFINISNMTVPVASDLNGTHKIISISTNTTTAIKEKSQITANGDFSGTLFNHYFLINSANDVNKYYVWYYQGGGGSDPMVPGRTGIFVDILMNDPDTAIASKTRTAMSAYSSDFNISGTGNLIIVENTIGGITTPTVDFNTLFAFSELVAGTNSVTTYNSTFIVNHADFGSTATTGGSVKRIKYSISPFREVAEDNVPIITSSAVIKNSKAYLTFTSDISTYLKVKDTIIISALTQPGLELLNGTFTIDGIQKNITNNDTIQISVIAPDSVPLKEKTEIQTVRDVSKSLASTYFFVNSANDATMYYVWYKVGGTGTDPLLAGKIGVEVDISTNDSDILVADATRIKLQTLSTDFVVSGGGAIVDITNVLAGATTPTTDNNTGFTINELVVGSDIISDNGGKITLQASTLQLPLNGNPSTEQLEGLQNLLDNIINNLIVEPTGIIDSALNFNPPTTARSGTVDLAFTVPDEVTLSNFYQIYRSPLETSTGVSTLSDLSTPSDEMNLVFEGNPTTAQLTAKSVMVHDIVPEDFRNGGTLLYTNPNSGEGITQANEPPPLAHDITQFKNYTFFANTQTKHRKTLNMLGIGNLVSGTSTITISNGINSYTYTFDNTGENAPTFKVLLADSVNLTPGQQLDATARSLVRVINKTASSLVYAYYLSGPTDVPGKILLEARTLSIPRFYVVSDSVASGADFQPNIEPKLIAAISASNPTIVNSVGHDLITGQNVLILGSDSSPVIDGERIITRIDNDNFSVPVNVLVAGIAGTIATEASDNEVKGNRLYYSKSQQPEAVPILNYLNIGPEDKKIVRILALRDSLFILKEEAVYRLSGDVAPFSVALFDSSTQIKSSDSAVVLNNLIYLFANQGVATVGDTGISIISRPIENLLLKILSGAYVNFDSATFGVSYESDRSYYFNTVTNKNDAVATQCFRYNTFTNTWTMLPISKTCGIVNNTDDKLYLGAGDTNSIEKERKDFSRTDYSDRSFTATLAIGAISGTNIKFGNIIGFDIGDVLVQTQTVSISKFNQVLRQLDLDTGTAVSDYFSSLEAVQGVDLRFSITNLALKLDADSGVADSDYASTISGFDSTFSGIKLAFNTIVTKLNADLGVSLSNYPLAVNDVEQEIDIVDLNPSTSVVTTRFSYPFISGPMVLYKSIKTAITWAPQTMSDPSMLKQAREGTLIFENDNITEATISFATDLSPDFEAVDFLRSGSGVFGCGTFGDTYTFGGLGTSAPFRTYIPRNKQRCRYIKHRFQHMIARESFSIYGISTTYELTSNRAYR